MMSKTFKLAAVTIAFLVGLNGYAQNEPKGWSGVAGASLSLASGNSSNSSVLLNAEADRATETDKTTVGGMVNYAKNKTGGTNQTTANKWGVYGQYDFNLTPDVYAFGKLGLDGDKATDRSLRSAVAGGLGYKVINTSDTTFDVFGGLGYTQDKYGVNQVIDGKTNTKFATTSIYLGESSTHQLSSSVSFKQRLDLYPGISGNKALIAKFNAGLSVAISTKLSLNVALVNTYNSKSAVGTKKNDMGLFTGMNTKF